jgi:eukaryotic translation initiation factor 2C
MRKQVPPEKTSSVLEFATKKPEARLESIVKGLQVLQYGQSEYLRSFGLSVDSSGPVKIQGRVLNPPTLLYGQGSRQPTVVSSSFLFYLHTLHCTRAFTTTHSIPPPLDCLQTCFSFLSQNPRNGEWNMIDKKLYKPASIQRWIVIIYERPQRFSQSAADDMISGLTRAATDMG